MVALQRLLPGAGGDELGTDYFTTEDTEITEEYELVSLEGLLKRKT